MAIHSFTHNDTNSIEKKTRFTYSYFMGMEVLSDFYMCLVVLEARKRFLNHLGLELPTVRILGTEPESSGRPATALNC